MGVRNSWADSGLEKKTIFFDVGQFVQLVIGAASSFAKRYLSAHGLIFQLAEYSSHLRRFPVRPQRKADS